MEYQLDSFKKGLSDLGIFLSDGQLNQFVAYYELLVEKNKVMNLTAITDFEEVVQKHFLDSLSLVKVLDMSRVNKILDMGTGAGFPGIPIKIAFPECHITLVDSVNKKIDFIKESAEKIGLHNLEAIHGRVEDLGHMEMYREQYDLVVSRAVAALPALVEYCLPFVKVGGDFLSYKSVKVDEELSAGKKAIQVLGGSLKKDIRFRLPGAEGIEMERAFLLIKKEKPCPKKYPRKAGTPTKTPIR